MKNAEAQTTPINDDDERISGHLELLSAMGQDFATSLDIDETLRHGLKRITDYVGAEGGALFLLDDRGEKLTCKTSNGPINLDGLTMSSAEGIVGRCVQMDVGEIVRDVSNDPNFHTAVDDKTGFTTRSILCAPMSVKGERIGAIELVNKNSKDGLFDDHDLHLLRSLSSSAALSIKNARMAEALVEQERVRRELELAAEIQRSLLPDEGDDTSPVHGVNCPARTVSGDFYDFFPLADGRICFNLGDVSGKGMNAALLMAKTASLFRCLGKTIHQPGRLLSMINDEICETVTRGMFVTMAGGIYDPKTGIVKMANAGHEPALIYSGGGTFEAIQAEAPPLGISPLISGDGGIPEVEFRLDGGTLYIFTDGVTEGYLEDGSELEADGLKKILIDTAGEPAATRLKTVIDCINRENVALRDDLTLLAIDDGLNKIARDERASSDEGIQSTAETVFHLNFPSQPDRLKLVRSAVFDTVMLCGCSESVGRDIVIAVDEACQNVIRHAYKGARDGQVILDIARAGDNIVLSLRDFAEPVDVSKIKPRDLDDLRPGGLGTHFIREVMDDVDYLPPPDGEGNLLRMVKRIE
ncbi:MAG: SpoIIE family protein phosphatase [Rhodospirillales bacterium]|nr:SpoIIE family protein phosphatase [Rhodospirillales bacterium]